MTPDELRRLTLGAVSSTPSLTRDEARRRFEPALAAAVAGAIAIFFAAGALRATQRPTALILCTSLGSAALAALALWRAWGRGGSMLGRSLSSLRQVLLLPPALLLWKLLSNARFPELSDPSPERLGLRCLGLGLAMGLGPLLVLLLHRRGSEPARPAMLGAALGTCAGGAAWVLIDLWCPVAKPLHLLLGHVLPLLLLGACGALAGRRLLALRLATRPEDSFSVATTSDGIPGPG